MAPARGRKKPKNRKLREDLHHGTRGIPLNPRLYSRAEASVAHPSLVELPEVLGCFVGIEFLKPSRAGPCCAAMVDKMLPKHMLHLIRGPMLVAEACGIQINPCEPSNRAFEKGPNLPSWL